MPSRNPLVDEVEKLQREVRELKRRLEQAEVFPDKFGGLDDGLAFCREFFPSYNDHHHHSALAYLTPRQVHYGQAEEVLRQRHEVPMTAHQAHLYSAMSPGRITAARTHGFGR